MDGDIESEGGNGAFCKILAGSVFGPSRQWLLTGHDVLSCVGVNQR